MIAAYSQRSADIEAAVDTAIGRVVLRTGRRPDVNAINRIRQHLTLATRDHKHAPNLAESVQRILVRRALAGQHPHTPEEIITWLEATVAGWNADPTPFTWGGKRAERRQRARIISAEIGIGSCPHAVLPSDGVR